MGHKEEGKAGGNRECRRKDRIAHTGWGEIKREEEAQTTGK